MERSPDLIIGYGNSLRRDDGLGHWLAEEIDQENWPGVAVLSVHQLTPDLALAIAAVERVFFLDARADWQPGMPLVTIQPLAAELSHFQLDHYSSPGTLLALAQRLYDRTPSAWLVAIAAQDFEFGEDLSPLAQEAKRQAKAMIRQQLGLRV